MNSYYEKLKQGLTGAVTVAAAAARQTAEVAKNLAEEITSFKALKDYKLAGHVATAGPGGSWKIFHALNKKPGEHVWCLSASSYTELAQAKWHGLWVISGAGPHVLRHMSVVAEGRCYGHCTVCLHAPASLPATAIQSLHWQHTASRYNSAESGVLQVPCLQRYQFGSWTRRVSLSRLAGEWVAAVARFACLMQFLVRHDAISLSSCCTAGPPPQCGLFSCPSLPVLLLLLLA